MLPDFIDMMVKHKYDRPKLTSDMGRVVWDSGEQSFYVGDNGGYHKLSDVEAHINFASMDELSKLRNMINKRMEEMK